MRIVHIEDFVHPDAGYQINMLARLQARQGHYVRIVSGEMDKIPSFLTSFFGTDHMRERDERFERETGASIVRVPLFGFYSGRAIFKPCHFRIVDELRPDVIFVHGEDTLTGILYIWRSLWKRSPMILDCHMLEMASVNRFREFFRWFYRKFVTPVILRRKIPLVRVVDTDFVEKCLGIPLTHTHLLSLGTDTDHFCPNLEVGQLFRAEHGISQDALLVLYAGKLDEHKGGLFLAETLCERIDLPNGRELVFLIVGATNGKYGRSVEAGLAASANRILRFPTQRYLDLAKFYQAANLALYPRQCSMSFFEAQSCGVPVLFERNEINDKRAAHGSCLQFEAGDMRSFRSGIVRFAELTPDAIANMRDRARQLILAEYDFVPIAQSFTNLMASEVERYRQRSMKR